MMSQAGRVSPLRRLLARRAHPALWMVVSMSVGCGGPTGPTGEPTTVTISPAEVELIWSDPRRQLKARVLDEAGNPVDATVSWSVTDERVATVDRQGLVDAVAEGETMVHATVGDVSDSVPILVHSLFSTLAFTSDRDGNEEIYAVQITGQDERRLTTHPAMDRSPAWSSDGTRIAFETDRDGNSEIYVMNADGSDSKRLTQHSAFDSHPAWSPDGSRISFSSDRDGNLEIYVMNADGSNPTNLTDNPGEDDDPTWSPDGSRIAFASSRDGDWEVYVMNADGSAQINLTASALDDLQPAWSPDGSLIAFTSWRDRASDVFIMGTDGSDPTNLTMHGRINLHPTWSPDGAVIVFERNENGAAFDMVDLDGSLPSIVLNNNGEGWIDTQPTWAR